VGAERSPLGWDGPGAAHSGFGTWPFLLGTLGRGGTQASR